MDVEFKKVKPIGINVDQVVKLGSANYKTLGHFPEGAFIEYSKKGLIIGALENKNIIGYLMFSITQRTRKIRIIHLCVKDTHRRKGLAVKLLNQIIEQYKNLLTGISLSCREDFTEANAFYKKFGFVPKKRVRSKSLKENYLIKYWYEFGNPDLFSSLINHPEKINVLLDTNIIIKLRDQNKNDKTGSKYLLSDWLIEEVEYYFASETYYEIDKDKNTIRAESTRNYLNSFIQVRTLLDDVEIVFKKLQKSVKGSTQNDCSDKKQLAECIVGNLDYFITTDQNILNHESILFNEFGLNVLNPTQFILAIDSIINHNTYTSSKFSGVNFNYRKLTSKEIPIIVDKFLSKQHGEKKDQFKKLVHANTSDVENCIVKVVSRKEEYFGVWIGKLEEESINIIILRVTDKNKSQFIFEQLVRTIIRYCLDEKIRYLKINEMFLVDYQMSLLKHIGFVLLKGTWFKELFQGIINSSNIKNNYKNDSYIELLQNGLKQNKENLYQVEVERLLWPLKFSNLDLPVYIIPIQAVWASELFDYKASNNTLFGSQSKLVWNRENVYFRSRYPVSEKAPGRILWYVSNSKYEGSRSKAIVATSYIDQVEIDRPKAIFRKYKMFGIYKWKHIYKLAKNDINNEIKAIKFSDTEVFENPVSLDRVNSILVDNGRKPNTFASPLEVSNKIFIVIYNEGRERR